LNFTISKKGDKVIMIKKALLVFTLYISAGCATVDNGSISAKNEQAQNTGKFTYTVVEKVILHKGYFPFIRSLNNKKYGYLTVEDPTGSSPVPVVERFEVQPGDCAEIDCINDRERSELRETGVRNKKGSTWWYGWSIYIPEGFRNVYPTKVAMGQFHQEDGKPAFMFQNHKGGLWLDSQLRNRYYRLIKKKDFRGKWHRIEVNAHWSRSRDGFFKVWVNGEQKVDFKGATMNKKLVYFKYGIYRSFLSRYKKGVIPAQIVYYANVRKYTTREGLLPKD